MQRRETIGNLRRWPPASLFVGLAVLAFSAAACGPNVPTVIAALPTSTVVAAVTSTAVAGTRAVELPPTTASATQRQAPAVVASRTPTQAPAATASASPTAPPSASSPIPSATAQPVAPELSLTPDAQALNRQVRLPILLYHYVEPWPADATTLRKTLTVQPADFMAQMAYLHDQGYVTVSLYDLMAALAQGTPLPPRAVVLTFDDGYRTLMDYAAPALKPLGYTGTVFVITQLMDENFTQYLTWPQAEALYAAGWKIEPHTKTHASLAGRARDYQLYEMLGSVQTVAAHIGTMPRFFAYPYGKWDDTTIELAREMHLWGAVTEIPGEVHVYSARYGLRRVRIDGTMTLPDFIKTIKATQ
jgi:peptidoglycan/xylan/chitin deacetylase (PgdA/CDA1 family)